MKIQMKAKQQQGFTIIELVVVILLLGILAATALPRFLDVTEEAHDAVVDGTASALQTGMALYRAQWIGQQQAAAGSQLDGGNVFGGLRVASSGYPIGVTNSSAGTFDAGATNSGQQCIEVYNGILQAGRAPVSASGLATDTTAEVTTPALLATAEADDNSDLFGISEGFMAKRVTATGTTIGNLANAVAIGNSYCIYVYAADANARNVANQDVRAIVYFPFATTGTAPVEAGTVLQVTL